MKVGLNIVGILFVMVGTVWTLQGTNILTQGAMAGRTHWAFIGIAVVVIGIVLFFVANRPKRK